MLQRQLVTGNRGWEHACDVVLIIIIVLAKLDMCLRPVDFYSSSQEAKAERTVTTPEPAYIPGGYKRCSSVWDGRVLGGMWGKLRKGAGSQAQKFCNGI